MKKEFELEVHAQVITYFTFEANSEEEIRDLWDGQDSALHEEYNYKMMKIWEADSELTSVTLVKYPYLILETWNGEGYSEENLLREVKEFEHDAAARKYVRALVKKEQGDHRIEKHDNGYNFMLDNDVDDSGSYQFIKKPYGAHVVVIFCNTNEVRVLNEQEYKNFLTEQWKLVVQDIFDEDGEPLTLEQALVTPRFFMHADDYDGDYDYQFQLISSAPTKEPARDNPVIAVTLSWANYVMEHGQGWTTAEEYINEAQEFITSFYFEEQEVADETALDLADKSWKDRCQQEARTIEAFIDYAFSQSGKIAGEESADLKEILKHYKH